MTSALTDALALAWLAGLGLGALFFGGLWWTVQKAVSSSQPALWFAGSLLLRTSVILAGLYWISGGHWERMVACLVGVVMARVAVTLRLRSGQVREIKLSSGHGIASVPETNRAP